MFFSEKNIISSHSAGQTTASLKKCESCTSGCWTPLDYSTWRRVGAAEFPEAFARALPPCKSELRAAFRGNEGIKFQIGLGKWSGWWGAWIQHTGSKHLLSCHLTQQVPNFLLESLSKCAKTWQSSDTWRHARASRGSQKSHSSPTPTYDQRDVQIPGTRPFEVSSGHVSLQRTSPAAHLRLRCQSTLCLWGQITFRLLKRYTLFKSYHFLYTVKYPSCLETKEEGSCRRNIVFKSWIQSQFQVCIFNLWLNERLGGKADQPWRQKQRIHSWVMYLAAWQCLISFLFSFMPHNTKIPLHILSANSKLQSLCLEHTPDVC